MDYKTIDRARKEHDKLAKIYHGLSIGVLFLVAIVILSGCSCNNGADVFRSCGEYTKQDCNGNQVGPVNQNC